MGFASQPCCGSLPYLQDCSGLMGFPEVPWGDITLAPGAFCVPHFTGHGRKKMAFGLCQIKHCQDGSVSWQFLLSLRLLVTS